MMGLGDSGVPITCNSDEQPMPITAWVTSPNDPAYLVTSNWKCVKKSDMFLQAGFTYSAGLETWLNPLAGFLTAITVIPRIGETPQFALGALTPLLVIGAFIIGGKGR